MAKAITLEEINIARLIKCELIPITGRNGEVFQICKPWPEIQIRNHYIRGMIATLGKDEGAYPLPYLEMIEGLFGVEPETMEVCSRYVQADGVHTKYTVDINPAFKPTFCCDAQTLVVLPPTLKVKRIRGDPPYNKEAAKKKYGTDLPDFMRLLAAGSKHLEIGGLFILLMGPVNYQVKTDFLGLRHVGTIALSVVPNFELRACNIFYKYAEGNDQLDPTAGTQMQFDFGGPQ